jgi:release factor glutamine methyltransferase
VSGPEPGPAGEGAPGSAGRPDLRSALREAARLLAAAGVGSPQHDARALAAHALGVERLEPAVAPEPPLSFFPAFAALVERRRAREPLQHIVGSAAFRYLTLAVRAGVFVPRPETELVAQQAIDEARRVAGSGAVPVVVDLCCGTGAIALAVATEVPGSAVTAVDASADAVTLTGENAAACAAPLTVLLGDATDAALLAELDGTVHVVVSNPPYIPPDAVPVDPEVRDHDPGLALYGGGPDGLEVPRGVVARAADLLRDGGLLVMEHADVQGAQVRDAVTATGAFAQVTTVADLTGRDRMVVARRVARHADDGT